MNKKMLLAILGFSAMAFAETGLEGGVDGLHQQSARTLGQWVFSAGLGTELTTDADAMAHGNTYTTNGKTETLDRIVPMVAGNVHMALGLTSFWDLGAVLPLNYDAVSDEYPNQHLNGAGIGDLQAWTKIRIPVDTNHVFNAAVLGQVYFPTGKHNTGLRPRHVWYVNSWGNSHAFTANDWAFEGELLLTFDFTQAGVPLRWNNNAGFVGTLHEGSNTVIWGSGLNLTAISAMDIFVEASGETRVEKTANPREPVADPMRLTPGVRLHLPAGFDLALGADIGINTTYDYEYEKTVNVVRIRDGVKTTYKEVGSAKYGVSALLTWTNKFLMQDEDKDGIRDSKDLCAHTPRGAKVDSVGCVVDEDQDGIPDYKDLCKNTPKGTPTDSMGCPKDSDHDGVADVQDKCPATHPNVSVNINGCPLDQDEDGVADYLDKCPNTRKGAKVDTMGCPSDADKDGVADADDKCPGTVVGTIVDDEGCPKDSDHDGIFDSKDKCPKTPNGISVDSLGCPVDKDHDGIPDYKDRCLNTMAGAAVDTTGCPTDADHDGVADALDKCPGTPVGTIVDTLGCPKDSDHDGVFDSKDKCPNTQAGLSVDSTGCVLDQDKDGVPDVLDKCPNTRAGLSVDSTGCVLDQDKDGVPDVLDKCPNTQANLSVDSTGCVLDQDKDGVPDIEDKCPGTLPGIKIKPDGCPVDKKQDLSQLKKGINFKPNSAMLTNASYSTLDDIVKLLRQTPSAKLEVQGHTDNRGKAAKNLNLSQKRAESVVDYFIKKGIEPSRLRAIGYGSERPIADNKTKAGRDANRRVELKPFE